MLRVLSTFSIDIIPIESSQIKVEGVMAMSTSHYYGYLRLDIIFGGKYDQFIFCLILYYRSRKANRLVRESKCRIQGPVNEISRYYKAIMKGQCVLSCL